jgi:multisubunit Na+/H+ antiporter MnhB subunit
MNCYLHPEASAIAFCRSCGRPLCAVCQRSAEGTVYCQDHFPAAAYSNQPNLNASGGPNPYLQPPPIPSGPRVETSPPLAFILGWIPGVGAIYNGQYVKGLVHVIIFGLIVSLLNSGLSDPGEAFLGISLGAFVIYMAFEAYHTAKKRQMGVVVEEWSSLAGQGRYGSRAPVGPIVLIVVGVLFLLDTLHVIEFRDIGRFWPVILIVIGAYMLYSRMTSHAPRGAQPFTDTTTNPPANGVMETRHEQ